MPDIKILRWVAGAGFAMVSLIIHAEALQTDPAWQKGRLTNGFSWQVLSTPQRSADRLQIRLVVNTGSLSETAQQTGFSHLLARIALVQNAVLTPSSSVRSGRQICKNPALYRLCLLPMDLRNIT